VNNGFSRSSTWHDKQWVGQEIVAVSTAFVHGFALVIVFPNAEICMTGVAKFHAGLLMPGSTHKTWVWTQMLVRISVPALTHMKESGRYTAVARNVRTN